MNLYTGQLVTACYDGVTRFTGRIVRKCCDGLYEVALDCEAGIPGNALLGEDQEWGDLQPIEPDYAI